MNTIEPRARLLRYAARSLSRRPVLAIVALTTLVLGIGANPAIFSIINVVLIEPLPFHDPDRLVMVWSTAPNQGLTEGLSSYPDFYDWSEQARHRWGVIAAAAVVLVATLLPWSRLGSEFMPPLNDGSVMDIPSLFPSIGTGQAKEILRQRDAALAGFPK